MTRLIATAAAILLFGCAGCGDDWPWPSPQAGDELIVTLKSGLPSPPQFLVDDLARAIAYYQKIGFTFAEP